jgi:hypothetical protein
VVPFLVSLLLDVLITKITGLRWLIPVILVTQEAEIRRIVV